MQRLIALLIVLATPAAAVDCADTTFENHDLTVCDVDATTEDLRLFHRDANGRNLGQFARIEATLDGKTLLFAMNGGMYHDDRRPVGMYVQDRVQTQAIITSEGPGNFGLLPNGVLCLTDTSAQVYESRAFAADPPACRDATQSGPMLVIDGALHPRFIPDGTSKYVRNGVGTSADGARAVFVIADTPINFHTFGRFFRDVLRTPNALYFDGKVSRLYSTALNRSDFGFDLGPVVGVVAP